MLNLNSRESELPERELTELGTTNVFNRLKGSGHSSYGGPRTDNAGLLDFDIQIEKSGAYVRLETSARRRRARNATTEFTIEGHNLGIHRGLQVLILKVTSETREQSQYSNSSNANVIPGPNFNGPLRPDFPPIEKYYLLAFDPDKGHIVVEAQDVWYLQFDTPVMAVKRNIGTDVDVALDKESGEVYAMYVSLTGLDYLKGAKLCTNFATPSDGPGIKEAPGLGEWVNWAIDSAIDDLYATEEELTAVKGKVWTAPIVKYNEQFKDAEDIYRVGHLRFVRLADGTVGGNSNNVVDHVQWYGIVPILNVEKSMSIALDSNYFKFHTDSSCSVCNQTVLELPPGKYAIDVNKTCFYYGKTFSYPYGKKAWILTMLANAEVIIEKSIADRIIPVGEMEDMSNIAYNDDDDFLNRI